MGWTSEEIFANTILWTDIMKLDIGVSVYEEVTDNKKIAKILDEKQDDYNHASDDKMELVFF